MSTARHIPVEPLVEPPVALRAATPTAQNAPSADVILLRPKLPAPPHVGSTAHTVAPKSTGERLFDLKTSSLHEPAPQASIAVAAVLAIVLAIAGVVVAVSLSGTPSIEIDARAPTTTTTTATTAASWRHGWGAAARPQ